MVTDKINPELLDELARANDATAEYIDSGNLNARNLTYGLPPEMVVGFLRSIAAAQRKLADDTREGKRIRERISTDG